MTARKSGHDSTLSRRKILKGTAGAGTVLTLAGCLTSDDDNGGNGTGNGTGNGNGDEWSNTLEVLHGWTGGDGAEAADALFGALADEYPGMDIDESPIGGGGNVDLDQTVANRLQGGDPPSSFAGWPGANLEQYEGVLGDIEADVWDEAGLKDAHAPEAVEACETEDGFSAVPIGSHRMNDLFYNVEVVEDAGVDPESLNDVDDLLDALDTIDTETDATPFGFSLAPWGILQTWAVTMQSIHGHDAYMDFIEGNGDRSEVEETFVALEEMLDNYINADAASVDFTEVNQDIMSGDAAFIHNGNWVAGAYITEGLEYGEEWDAVQFPGTEEMYGLHIDSFIYPGDNPSPEETAAFMRFIGSETAQVEFNRLKGSIPTREGTPTDDFSPYLADTIEDFDNAEEKPPTLAHGLAVDQSTQADLEEVLNNEFADPFDVESATDGFMDVF
ncbi:ABC transporter substrate-binding protein [Natranaeroarchaeum aerophilus]|uniref:ABC transporter substrate-binding protein n=1 Tax=Natranaeroarchaeum aerophilus TaxID=2917711 RepID=A0AAE3FRR5_9EURY|nr:ABC transporter substrate-binding protein [Natranaeroarchaeum aerophilus]MCL9813870.1 ABC transporter substrate-binding protein [Natranaeroarchaeum aerophilus]